jgi:hypothetical protein
VARFGLALCVLYGLVKTCVRYWLFRPVHARPAPVRSNEVLRLLDLGAVVALIGAFFLLANELSLASAAMWIAGLLVYDVVARRCFLELEVRRLCAKSDKWTRDSAMRHIKRRAQSPMFH